MVIATREAQVINLLCAAIPDRSLGGKTRMQDARSHACCVTIHGGSGLTVNSHRPIFGS
jgi:hypothetical protein